MCATRRNAQMSQAKEIPPCRSVSGGGGGTPLVRTADAHALHAESEPQQRTRPVDCALSRRCGTSRTAGEDASTHPGSPHPLRSTRVGTTGSGPPRSPRDRTARTTGWRTSTPYGCAATAWCRQRHHVTPDPCPLPSGASGTGHPWQSVRGTRVPNTGGGVVWASRCRQSAYKGDSSAHAVGKIDNARQSAGTWEGAPTHVGSDRGLPGVARPAVV